MRVGAATVDITPKHPVELAGFLARQQPSVGAHDPINVRALYVEQGGDRLVVLHADLLGHTADFVRDFRAVAQKELGLAPRQLMLSCTHTHAGPATQALINCGNFEADFVRGLHAHFLDAARRAIAGAEPATLVWAEGHCDLALHRRGPRAYHVDHRIGTFAFRRADGSYVAVLANYAMHNVGLSHDNRQLSGDIGGHAAMALEQRLPGRPCVLFTAGAAGNINPPTLSTDYDQIARYGAQLADGVQRGLTAGVVVPEPALATSHATLDIPLDPVTPGDVDRIAAGAANEFGAKQGYVADRFRDAVTRWRDGKRQLLADGTAPRTDTIDLQAVCLGGRYLLGVNAEIFSRLADDLRAETGRVGYVVGYTNGNIGYVATDAAYDEPGYEVDSAFIFYNAIRVARGGFERVRDRAADLIKQTCGGPR